MAYGLDGLRGSGFDTDLSLFRFWADNLAAHGPFGFYDRGFFADYTPGYLYPLWLVGIVGSLVGGVGDLIKLPAIVTDIVLAWVVYRMVLDLGISAGRARLAAIVVLVNPVTWFDSVVWGQVDSFGTVFLLLAVRELWRDRPERAAILAVVAALIKPQLAILIPIVAVVTIRRALAPAGGFGDDAPPERTGFEWERRTRGAVRILTTAAAGFVTAVVLAAPFGLSVVSVSPSAPFLDSSLVRLVFSTAATYPFVTVNAYNLWALFPLAGQSMATDGAWIPDAPVPDAPAFAHVGPFPAALVGGVLLAALLFLVIPAIVARRPDRMTILVGTCALAVAFFAVPTRVHERYLFPLFGLAAILVAVSWRWRVAYVAASFAAFLNMYVVLTTLYPNNPSVADWLGIGPTIRSFGGVAVIALVNTGLLVFALAELRAAARRRLSGEVADARAEAARDSEARIAAPASGPPVLAATAGGPILATAAAGSSAAAASGRPAPAPDAETPSAAPFAGGGPGARAVAPASGPAAATAAPGRLVPAWFERPGWMDSGPLGWLRTRMAETPIRADRSRLLSREGGGRLDRLDLWILVVLVVASMGLRTFRLAEPARMHFDEVYHARTAAEFLQYWRYGISHDIYEWTHPHLAKYAMAAGIVLFAGHDVAASSQLGTKVTDAAIEPRRVDPEGGGRAGDRVWVATGDGVTGYDLETRTRVADVPVPGATAVAFDADNTRLLVGTAGGELFALDGAQVDAALAVDPGAAPDAVPLETTQIATVGAPIRRLAVFDGGGSVAATIPGDTVAVVDPTTGEVRGRTTVRGVGEMTAAGTADAIVATTADITDREALAKALASVLGGDEASFRTQLAASGDTIVLDEPLTSDARTKIEQAVSEGRLPGIAVQPAGRLAVAGATGVTFLGPSGTVTSTVPIAGGATSVALVSGVDEGTQIYATSTGDGGKPQVAIIAVSGDAAKDGPTQTSVFALPGAGRRIVYDVASEMVEVLGATPDGSGTTVYVVEPHGKAVFADHRLPYEPAAWVLDHNDQFPTQSRGAILAFSAQGETSALDVGHYHFSWRLPGVILGALTTGVLFLLARVLFRRRSVAVLAGLFVLLDGMFFVQSRIAMNDVYTGFFILAAYLLFAWLWMERRRAAAFWALMPVIGVLLGLALASKWVAAYAIGALGILVLVRSALGRIILIVGLIGLTGVLGWMAMAVPVGSTQTGNLLFPMIMIALTLAAVVITIYHPIAWSDDEVRLAVGGPALLGILVVLAAIALGKADRAVALGPLLLTPLTVGFALVVAGGLAYVAFQLAGRFAMGPMARHVPTIDGSRPPEGAPPAEGWLRLGTGLGLPIAWMLLSLIGIPLGVYVLLYVPWAFVDSHQIVTGWPPGHTGQTLIELTQAMYRYHNDLTAAHAASSPWWAWPLNLKPVWFYQGSYASQTAASIYDAGNMVIWWMGIPAMAYVALQAFRRRSLALALILIGFLAQWISWARIDRAAFQYHYYTSLPFIVLALGYFMAELWHGASRRTWLIARIAAATALLGPVILWLLRLPLCGVANVESVNKASQACNGNPGNLVITPAALAMAVVGIVTLVVLVRQLVELSRPRADGRPLAAGDVLPLVATAILGGGLLAVSRLLPSTDPLLSFPGIVPEIAALVVAVPLLLVATQVLTARDARRFVLGFVAAAAFWFVLLYPNISALPLPSTLVNAYQGILPTYLYAFQFGVNTVARGTVSFQDSRFAILVVFLVIACVVVAWSARAWRLAAAGGEGPGAAGGPAGEHGEA